MILIIITAFLISAFSFIHTYFSKIDVRRTKRNLFLTNEIFLHNLQVHSLGAYLQQLVTWLPLHQPRRRAQDQFWAEEVLSFPLPHLPQDPFQDPLCQLQHHYPKIEYHLLPHLNHKIEYSLIHHKVNICILALLNI